MVYSAQTYAGTQIYRDTPTSEPWLVLALFTCAACGSTRAAILHDGIGENENEKPEDVAAE